MNKRLRNTLVLLAISAGLCVLLAWQVKQQKYYVKKFVKQHSFIYNPAKRLLEMKKRLSDTIFGVRTAADGVDRTDVRQSTWSLQIDAAQSAGMYKRFWGNLGFESFKSGVLSYRNRLLLEMMRDSNSRYPGTFRYIRAHNLFSNGVAPWGEGCEIYHEDEHGRPRLTWSLADSVFDRVIGYGFKPIVEFGFMPDKLASIPDRRQQWGKANISPPKDYDKWWTLVNQTVAHFRDRYGTGEINTWYFEVWNEPDLGWLFWIEDPKRKPFGDVREYFKLYDVTVDAAKSACPTIRVGGPASAGGDIDLLLEHLYLESDLSDRFSPIDFVSSHAYGKLGYDYRQKPKESITGAIHWKLGRAVEHDHPRVRQAMESLPFLLTETGPTTDGSPLNNTEYLSAWLVKLVDAVFYMHDELGARYTPREAVYWAGNQVVRYFEDGKGIATYLKRDGESYIFKRPAYIALEALGRLRPERIRLVRGSRFGDAVNAIATKGDDGSLQVLLYHLHESMDEADRDTVDVKIEIANLPFSAYEAKVYRIDRAHSNVFSKWRELGEPVNLTKRQLALLSEQNELQQDGPIRTGSAADGRYSIRLRLEGPSVVLVELRNRND